MIITKKMAMLEVALRDCVRVMGMDLAGLLLIQKELHQAEKALEDMYLVDAEFEPWSGEGLPPVGTVCERMWASGPASYVEVRVIAHDEGQAVYRFLGDRRKGEVQADAQGDGDSCGNPIFRPVRTPEQIAAEEREKAIEELFNAIHPGDRQRAIVNGLYEVIKKHLGDIYDAGYRKQVQP